jgi:hypothetical protein
VADSPAFERAAAALESLSGLDRLGARGTLRLALKSVGLEAKTATRIQVQAIVSKVLPGELDSRGIADPASICAKIAVLIADIEDTGPGRSALEVFQRMAGSGKAEG